MYLNHELLTELVIVICMRAHDMDKTVETFNKYTYIGELAFCVCANLHIDYLIIIFINIFWLIMI